MSEYYCATHDEKWDKTVTDECPHCIADREHGEDFNFIRGTYRKCEECPHDVGDSYQRDCSFPDCSGGWEAVSKHQSEQIQSLTTRIAELEQERDTWKQTSILNAEKIELLSKIDNMPDDLRDARIVIIKGEMVEWKWRAESAEATIQEIVEAIEWACGIRGDFSPDTPKRKGHYWWREMLRKKAGLVYNDDCSALILQQKGEQ